MKLTTITLNPALDRTTNMKGVISNMTLAEIREADAGIKFGEAFKGEKIPTFEEVLSLVDGRVPLLVELKGENFDTSL